MLTAWKKPSRSQYRPKGAYDDCIKVLYCIKVWLWWLTKKFIGRWLWYVTWITSAIPLLFPYHLTFNLLPAIYPKAKLNSFATFTNFVLKYIVITLNYKRSTLLLNYKKSRLRSSLQSKTRHQWLSFQLLLHWIKNTLTHAVLMCCWTNDSAVEQ